MRTEPKNSGGPAGNPLFSLKSLAALFAVAVVIPLLLGDVILDVHAVAPLLALSAPMAASAILRPGTGKASSIVTALRAWALNLCVILVAFGVVRLTRGIAVDAWLVVTSAAFSMLGCLAVAVLAGRLRQRLETFSFIACLLVVDSVWFFEEWWRSLFGAA
jgi:hypothetical protein